MNQLANKTYRKMRKELLESVTIKCKECNSLMTEILTVDFNDSYDKATVGYNCEDCTHHYLFD